MDLFHCRHWFHLLFIALLCVLGFVYWVLYNVLGFFPSYYTCQSFCQSSITISTMVLLCNWCWVQQVFTHVNKHNTHASVSLAGLYENTKVRSVTVISLQANIHHSFATASNLNISHGRQTTSSLCRSWLQLQGSIDWMYHSVCVWRQGH